MKIVFFNFNLSGSDSGIGLVTRNVTRRLVARKHEVHVIAQRRHKLTHAILPAEEIMDGVHIHRIHRPKHLLGTLRYSLQALALVCKIKPDITHEQELSGLGYLSKKLFGYPYIVLTQGCDIFEMRARMKPFAKRILEHADTVVSTSNDSIRYICEHITPNINAKIIPHGLDPAEYPTTAHKSSVFTFLYVGRLITWKGLADILEAIKLLKPQRLQLVVIGTGKDEQELKRMVTPDIVDKVIFKGQLPHKTVLQEMANTHAFILPIQRNETQSLVTLEAMACGVPVLVTDLECMREVVQDGVNGLLVPPKNPRILAAKMQQLMDDRPLCKKIVLHNSGTLSQYSYDVYTRRFEEVYADAIHRSAL